MAKKTIYPGTEGRNNKVLKRLIDLKGTNKVPKPWVNVRWSKLRLACALTSPFNFFLQVKNSFATIVI